MEVLREMKKILSHDSRYLGTRHQAPDTRHQAPDTRHLPTKTLRVLTLNQSAQSLDDDVDEADDGDYDTDDNDEENYDDGDDDDDDDRWGSRIAFGEFKFKISDIVSTIFRYLVVFLSPFRQVVLY